MSTRQPRCEVLDAARVREAASLLRDPAPLLAACAQAADPQQALLESLEIIRARARRSTRADLATSRDPAWLACAARLSGASRHAGRVLRRQPRLIDWLLARAHAAWPDHSHRLRKAFARASDAETLMGSLRRHRRRSTLEIAWRDLGGELRFGEVVVALSRQAEILIEGALGWAHAEVCARFGGLPGPAGEGSTPGLGVLALGKLGGRELNYSSDVDLIVVYDRDGETGGGPEGTTTAFAFAAAVTERLAHLLGHPTDTGEALRVDLDLRPEGRSGPLASSLAALEHYYATFGRTWERQAWIKARPIAGDLALGRRAIDTLQAFVYPRSLDHRALDAVGAMKAELDRQAQRRGHARSDLKLGRGGIRTIEFIVQALQLLHGGKNPALQVTGTLEALQHLEFAGHLAATEAQKLAEAYVLLRRVEHLLQIHDNRQTHRLPDDPRRQEAIARALGLAQASTLLSRLQHHRDAAASLGDARFGHSEEDGPSSGVAEVLQTLHAPGTTQAPGDREALAKAFARAGFRDAPAAAAHLASLARRPLGPFGRAASTVLAALGRDLLEEVLLAPDRDAALSYLARFLTAIPGPAAPGLLKTLAARPPLRSLLVSVFGSSHHLARTLLSHPELLDDLLLRGPARTALGPEALSDLWSQRSPRPQASDEAKLGALRRFKSEMVLQIGIQDVAGTLSLPEVSAALTALAEQVISVCLVRAEHWATRRFGWPRRTEGGPVGLLVVALGRLGAREMGYGSDLDLLFLHQGEGESPGAEREGIGAQEFFARLAQRAISFLTLPMAEGTLYAIDTKLRPSGTQGALVTTLSAFRRYHQNEAEVWERQALTRARVVASLHAEAGPAQTALASACFERLPEEATLRRSIHQMRERQRAERADERGDRKDPRAGFGGLLDVEFIVQFLQLRHGPDSPRLRTTSTAAALLAIEQEGLLPARQAIELRNCWAFLRRLENRLRIVHDRPIHAFPTRGPDLDALARRMGYHQSEMSQLQESAGLSLLEEYARVTRQVRQIFVSVFGETRR